MPCCQGKAPVAKLLVLSGTDMGVITSKLQQDIVGAKFFHPDMEYLPGDVVPLASVAQNQKERVVSIVDRAVEVVNTGIPAILASDAWGNHSHAASHILRGSNMQHIPVAHALVHKSLKAIARNAKNDQKLVRSLIDFGALYKGESAKPKMHLGFLSTKDVQGAIDRLGELCGSNMAPSDVKTLQDITKKHLLTSLGFPKSPTGVYLVPRAHYDAVVDSWRPRNAAKALASLEGSNCVLKDGTYGSNFVINVQYPHFCKMCIQGSNMGITQPYMCGQCMRYMHAIREEAESKAE